MDNERLFTVAREAILSILRQEWEAFVGQIREEDGPKLVAIAHDAARYAQKLAEGDPMAEHDLAYVKANTLLLVAGAALRENERVEVLLLKVADVAARIAGQILLKIPVA